MRALFYSKGSVLLLHDFSGSVTDEYLDVAKQIIAVELSKNGFERLCLFIQETYHLDATGQPIQLRGEWKDEKFYQANGHYSMLKNCNNWDCTRAAQRR